MCGDHLLFAPQHKIRIVTAGVGMSGIIMAYKLKHQYGLIGKGLVDFVAYEKNVRFILFCIRDDYSDYRRLTSAEPGSRTVIQELPATTRHIAIILHSIQILIGLITMFKLPRLRPTSNLLSRSTT